MRDTHRRIASIHEIVERTTRPGITQSGKLIKPNQTHMRHNHGFMLCVCVYTTHIIQSSKCCFCPFIASEKRDVLISCPSACKSPAPHRVRSQSSFCSSIDHHKICDNARKNLRHAERACAPVARRYGNVVLRGDFVNVPKRCGVRGTPLLGAQTRHTSA